MSRLVEGLWVPPTHESGRQGDLWGLGGGAQGWRGPVATCGESKVTREHVGSPLVTNGEGRSLSRRVWSCAGCLCGSPDPLWASVPSAAPVAEGRQCCLGSGRKGRLVSFLPRVQTSCPTTSKGIGDGGQSSLTLHSLGDLMDNANFSFSICQIEQDLPGHPELGAG